MEYTLTPRPIFWDHLTQLYSLPVQLLAYQAVLLCSTDIDRPHNLAKSVTVE